jgi:hypothetical protein
MPKSEKPSVEAVLGRAPEQLTLDERWALAGSYIAMEIYSPETLPLRRIEAIGQGIPECVAMLRRRGLDPSRFEYTSLKPPY